MGHLTTFTEKNLHDLSPKQSPNNYKQIIAANTGGQFITTV
jgi:hypothetical protein